MNLKTQNDAYFGLASISQLVCNDGEVAFVVEFIILLFQAF